jgi:toxin ParE1/3/4
LKKSATILPRIIQRERVSFIREIREQCVRIAAAPLGYVARPELGEGLRSCTHQRYLIVFQYAKDEVLIVRVLHGSRDITALFYCKISGPLS